MADTKEQVFEVPKVCKAGVVVNEGPDFRVEVQEVPVPEISMSAHSTSHFNTGLNSSLLNKIRT